MFYFRIRLQPLFVFSLLITAASTRPASAETLGLDFSLPTSVRQASPGLTIPAPRYEPLAIPPEAISPPIQTQTQAAQLPPPPGSVTTPRILLPVSEASLILFGELPPENKSTRSELLSKDDPDETLFIASHIDADNISFALNQESKPQELPTGV